MDLKFNRKLYNNKIDLKTTIGNIIKYKSKTNIIINITNFIIDYSICFFIIIISYIFE